MEKIRGCDKKAVELVKTGRVEKEGRKARRFVENNDWNKIVDEFEEVLWGYLDSRNRRLDAIK